VAKCTTCGKPAGIMFSLCPECGARLQEEQKALADHSFAVARGGGTRPEPQAAAGEPVGARSIRPSPSQVVVTDIDMPFWSMVVFMVKWALASIPAGIVLLVTGLLLYGMFVNK